MGNKSKPAFVWVQDENGNWISVNKIMKEYIESLDKHNFKGR